MAQKTSSDLKTDVQNKFPDNNSGQITPAVTRGFFDDLIDSFLNLIDTGFKNVSSVIKYQTDLSGDFDDLSLVDKNYVDSNTQKYTKIVVFDDTPVSNFNSGQVGGQPVFADIPDLQITIDRIGDYTFYVALNCNHDQNEELDLTIALTPIDNRDIDLPNGTTITVPAGTQFTSEFQTVVDRQQKNNDQTISGTFLFDNLKVDDLIDFRINTRGDNVDLSNRRAYGYTINANPVP